MGITRSKCSLVLLFEDNEADAIESFRKRLRYREPELSLYRRTLSPDDSFPIQEVFDHLHTIAQLSSSRLGHRKESTTWLARL